MNLKERGQRSGVRVQKKKLATRHSPRVTRQSSVVEVSWKGRPIGTFERLVKGRVGEWLDRRGGGMVSVLMTDTPTVHGFNRKYRGVPTPTAVMSFPQESHKGQGIRGKLRLDLSLIPYPLPLKVFGDIVIAVDAVRRYARLERTRPEAILAEFVAHGLKGLVKA